MQFYEKKAHEEICFYLLKELAKKKKKKKTSKI